MAEKKAEKKKDYTSYTRTRQYGKIKKDLVDQLEMNGNLTEFYSDLIEDYMSFWVTKCLLTDDIRERGTVVEYDNGGGQKGKKKNDSVEQMIKINAQMLKLLSEMGIKPTGVGGDLDEL